MITLARHAMATRFEFVLHGEDPVALRAAGEAALDEIDRLEAQLSLYRPTSEIARVNALAARRSVRLEPRLFQLLKQAGRLSVESGGSFDITIAPLVRAWGFMGGTGAMPEAGAVEEARAQVGMGFVELNESDCSIRFTKPGLMLDLGAIGKGYALECAAEVLAEAGVSRALLHGGTSTIRALGPPPGADGWTVALPFPRDAAPGHRNESKTDESRPLALVELRDESLSVSAVWGRSFEQEGETLGHVIDPRTGRPVRTALMAAVVVPSATESDALSTALLTAGEVFQDQLERQRPGARSLLVKAGAAEAAPAVRARGITISP